MEKCGDNSRVLVRDVAAALGRAGGDYDTGSGALKANKSNPGAYLEDSIKYFKSDPLRPPR
ncbi:hypothetical protein FOPG_18265 [Fusarium oxysporum f. sp. conglutinans race 2 54008]|uniref:Uncharacterized protein n=1 Tax=Fusarium oxysporum f. sp. conglutinans race 2 54008 TaxID=1089457 RepID=X0HWH4_FUSOX|nr:hypothetical protein FOPG_18265 [Fusarium oxysporum f. sp. conglutinans race 2 54008]